MSQLKSCAHAPFGGISIGEAATRGDRGEQQGCCPICGKWVWPHLFNTRTDYLEAMDWADHIAAAIQRDEQIERRRRRRRQ